MNNQDANELTFDDKVVIIKIQKTINIRKSIYDATRFAWKINVNRANEADYILAVDRGIIVGVFKATNWMSATRGNFPYFGEHRPDRFGFEGIDAPDCIKRKYINKQIPEEYRRRGAGSPIRYTY